MYWYLQTLFTAGQACLRLFSFAQKCILFKRTVLAKKPLISSDSFPGQTLFPGSSCINAYVVYQVGTITYQIANMNNNTYIPPSPSQGHPPLPRPRGRPQTPRRRHWPIVVRMTLSPPSLGPRGGPGPAGGPGPLGICRRAKCMHKARQIDDKSMYKYVCA